MSQISSWFLRLFKKFKKLLARKPTTSPAEDPLSPPSGILQICIFDVSFLLRGRVIDELLLGP